MWFIVLCSPALAQDAAFAWSDPAGEDRFPNAVASDLDGDGLDDLAIGIPGRCGAVDVWLSTVESAVGLPAERGDIWLGPATVRIEPDACDPTFGVELAVGGAVLGTSPDRGGAPTSLVSFEGGKPELWVTGGQPTDPSAAEECDACCGPAPCCTTGGGGGVVWVGGWGSSMYQY